MIRKIEWLNSDSPAYIGYFGIKPESFRQFMERAGPLKEKYDGLPVEEKQYQISYMIDEGYEGRGLLTVSAICGGDRNQKLMKRLTGVQAAGRAGEPCCLCRRGC